MANRVNLNAAVKRLAAAKGLQFIVRNDDRWDAQAGRINTEWLLGDERGHQYTLRLGCGGGWGPGMQEGWGGGVELFRITPDTRNLVTEKSKCLLNISERKHGSAATKLVRERFVQWADSISSVAQ